MNTDQTAAAAAVPQNQVFKGQPTLLKRFEAAATGGTPLTAAEREELGRVTHIGAQFLCDCTGITALDLSPLHSVTSIGNHFLYGCAGINALDLAPLSNATTVGEGFLRGCYGIKSLDLSPLKNLTSVGHDFLTVCTGLTVLDLTPLKNVTSVGQTFLYGCIRLSALDLSPLRSLTSIDRHFLAHCSGLTELAVSPLAMKLGWNGKARDELAHLLIAFNKKRVADLRVSWNVRKMALLIRNTRSMRRQRESTHISEAFKIWSVMRHIVRFLSPLRVPDAVLIEEEKSMIATTEARSA